MEAKDYDYDYQTVDDTQQTAPQAPLAREYHPVELSKIQVHKQARELSFFSHLAAYCLLMTVIMTLCLAVLPVFLAFPIGLILPLGLILGVKEFYKLLFRNKS